MADVRRQPRAIALLAFALVSSLVTVAPLPTAAQEEGPPDQTILSGTVRDFQSSHPDFQYRIGTDRGIVTDTIGPDRKPVYAYPPGESSPTTNGVESFDQWYRDVEGVNLTTDLDLTLTRVQDDPAVYRFDDGTFFPIDNQLFGNEGQSHNYWFTFEVHAQFTYQGGEVFTFRGDDDVWVYINDELVIDLGGVHGAQTASVDLDAVAASIGIAPGNDYAFDLFFAERHTSASSFRMGQRATCTPRLQTSSTGTATSIGLEDVLGSVRHHTDPTGSVTGSLSYAPFGELVSGTPATPFGYTGEWTDPGGHVYLRARVYQPSTGRFLTTDPIQPNHPGTQGWNQYTYTTNNPVTFTDPSGLAPLFEFSLKSAAIGAVIAGSLRPGEGVLECRSHHQPGSSDYVWCVVGYGALGAGLGFGFGGFGPVVERAFTAVAVCLSGAATGAVGDEVFDTVIGRDRDLGDRAESAAIGCLGGLLSSGGGPRFPSQPNPVTPLPGFAPT